MACLASFAPANGWTFSVHIFYVMLLVESSLYLSPHTCMHNTSMSPFMFLVGDRLRIHRTLCLQGRGEQKFLSTFRGLRPALVRLPCVLLISVPTLLDQLILGRALFLFPLGTSCSCSSDSAGVSSEHIIFYFSFFLL